MKKLLLLSILACGPAAVTPPPNDMPPKPTAKLVAGDATRVQLPEGVTPLAYDLFLDVDPRKDEFSGHTRITIKVDAPQDTIVMHARSMRILKAAIDQTSVQAALRFAFGGKEDPEELVLAGPVSAGEHTIDLDYEAPFNRQLRGLYKVEQNGKAWAFTQLEAVDARRMFPGFDEPRFKTPFTVHVRAPSGMTVVCNNPVESKKDELWNFSKTLPLPTYLLALAVGELEITEGPKTPVPVRLVSVPGKGKLGALSLEAAAAYLDILGKYFDRPYPYPKLDIAAVPDFGPGAMENPGLVTFREELLLLDPKQTPIWARRRMEGVMAHELAHQWFGDLVTMKWWDDIWLNEGFATWMAAKAVDVRRPEMRSRVEQIGGKLSVMSADAMYSARPVRVPVNTSDAILESGGWTAYVKGQGLLAMLESHAGEDSFRDGLRAYIKSHEFGIVTSDDLVASLSKATGKDMTKIAKSFLDQPGVPLLSTTLVCDKAGAHVHVEQSAMRALGSKAGADRVWTIPICMRAEGVKDPVCATIDAKSADIPLPKCPTWIEPNAGDRAYVRWSLPAPLVSALAKSKTMDEPERAAFVSNTWALVQSGALEPDAALDALSQMDFAHESSRLVLDQAIAMLTSVRDALVDEKSAPKFRAFVTKTLSPALARLGEDPKQKEVEDDRLARLDVTAALFDLGDDAKVKFTAEKRAQQWLKDPTTVDPDLGALALRISSRAKGVATPQVLREKLETASPSDRVMLTVALGSTPDPAALRANVEAVLQGKIRAGDFRYLYVGASRQPDSRAIFLATVMDRLGDLGKKLGGAGGLAGMIGWTCDWKTHHEVASFFEGKMKKLEGAQRSFEEGREASELCISLREHHSASATKFFSR